MNTQQWAAVRAHAERHGRKVPALPSDVSAALADAQRDQQTLADEVSRFTVRTRDRATKMMRQCEDACDAIADRARDVTRQRVALDAEAKRARSNVYIGHGGVDLAKRTAEFNASADRLQSDARDANKRFTREREDFERENAAEMQRLAARGQEIIEWFELLSALEQAEAASARMMADLDRRAEAQRLGYA